MLSSLAIGIRGKVSPGLRLFSLLIAGVCLAVLITAAGVAPSAEGHGTHTRLGLPACQWVIRFGKPCPMCGMTTSFSHAASFEYLQSLKVQPMGTFLALLTSSIFWIALHVSVTGSGLGVMALAMLRPRVVWALLGIFLCAWLYKIMMWNSPW